MTDPAAERFAQSMLAELPLVEAPESVWRGIEARLDAGERPRPAPVFRWPRWAFAIAAIFAIVAAIFWRASQRGWIDTGHSSQTIAIGQIGTVTIAPGTRLRVVADRPEEHRLALQHGEIHARITAPPRLFFVDTASGTAIDLGCEYTLTADDRGAGELHVTRGWVAFVWQGRESLTPAGAMVRTRPVSGPGIPYFEDASSELKRAVDGRLDVNAALGAARPRDTLTLWHLLQRVSDTDRAPVYDRIATLAPLPASIDREKVLRLDPEALKLLKEELAWTW